MILDIHSHKEAPYPEGIINLESPLSKPVGNQLYSVGIHPWSTVSEISDEDFKALEDLAVNPQIAAIGECGIDLLKGGPLFRQLQIFRRQIEISETVCKPLVIHCVKASDIILGVKRDIRPEMPWVIHGFRGKPGLASQLMEAGIILSFGEKFNPETIAMMPQDKILAETDESHLGIEEIINNLSLAAGRNLKEDIAGNISRLL